MDVNAVNQLVAVGQLERRGVRVRCPSAGIEDYLGKPVAPEPLDAVLTDALGPRPGQAPGVPRGPVDDSGLAPILEPAIVVMRVGVEDPGGRCADLAWRARPLSFAAR